MHLQQKDKSSLENSILYFISFSLTMVWYECNVWQCIIMKLWCGLLVFVDQHLSPSLQNHLHYYFLLLHHLLSFVLFYFWWWSCWVVKNIFNFENSNSLSEQIWVLEQKFKSLVIIDRGHSLLHAGEWNFCSKCAFQNLNVAICRILNYIFVPLLYKEIPWSYKRQREGIY